VQLAPQAAAAASAGPRGRSHFSDVKMRRGEPISRTLARAVCLASSGVLSPELCKCRALPLSDQRAAKSYSSRLLWAARKGYNEWAGQGRVSLMVEILT